ncbi:MAG: hypothetical protein AAFZ63_08105 [Bacteroidota bacterium]
MAQPINQPPVPKNTPELKKRIHIKIGSYQIDMPVKPFYSLLLVVGFIITVLLYFVYFLLCTEEGRELIISMFKLYASN